MEQKTQHETDWLVVARDLAATFAERAAMHDADDSFVAQNYAALKGRKLFSAGIPAELGGGGASHATLCQLLRVLAGGCGSTALALAMHTHLIAGTVWRWKHGDKTAEPLLRRVAAEELILVSSGGSDWLDGSGTAEKVEGGFKITARKVFGSGSPGGQLLLTMAVYDDPEAGRTVLHLPIPLAAPGVAIQDNWRTLGMRGTGSNDIAINEVFVPDAAIAVRRPAGKWHRFWDVVSPLVWPLVYSVYAGVADAARAVALSCAASRREDPFVQALVGEMETELATADVALAAMIANANEYDYQPMTERSRRTYMYKTVVARSVLAAVDKAMEVAGGASFYRSTGLERLFRDVQGARFHPFTEKRQYQFSGRITLGLDGV
ncbi:MAG TPA: acyl-CoA dehydrogenase family protein [Polyangia bacterium]|nr:acyl-CoA dehydrogenase family protein [Polyangia bacterium]